MSRKVRKVPKNWVHPVDNKGHDIPLMDGYKAAADEFMTMANEEGLQEAVEYMGRSPDKEDYMPEWSDDEKTHLMMYETCSEGTPISGVFETAEELARWLADSGSSSFASMTATYEQWLNTCHSGGSMSAVYSQETGLISGVEALSELKVK